MVVALTLILAGSTSSKLAIRVRIRSRWGAPHRERIRTRIASLLEVDPARINVKATTTEGLGFTGRNEGLAAQAVVSLSLPDHERGSR